MGFKRINHNKTPETPHIENNKMKTLPITKFVNFNEIGRQRDGVGRKSERGGNLIL